MIELVVGFLLYYQALIREVINGAAFVLLVTLSLMIAIFLWDSWVKETITLREWRSTEGVSTACVLWWIFTAEGYRTFNVWYSYLLSKSGAQGPIGIGVGIFSASTANSTIGYLVAGVVLNAALLGAIYRFTPPAWRHSIWLYALGAATVFVSAPTIYDIIT